MKGRLIDFSLGMNKKQRVTIELDGNFREEFERLKNDDVSVEIKKYHNTRSISANAYFHVLVNKIAAAQGIGDDEAKNTLVCEYGTLAKDNDGLTVGFKLPSSVDVSTIYSYAKCFDVREEDGKLFSCYLVYKRTRKMDSKEMARLIDGAIFVAKELGIETDTPQQLAKHREYWERSEK